VLLGKTDLVPVAHALHRRTLGPEQPFIVCELDRIIGDTHSAGFCPQPKPTFREAPPDFLRGRE
jgi:hypothetical protein